MSYRAHLPSTIYHLFHLILRSIKSHQYEKTAASKLQETLSSAQLLARRTHYRPALKLLRNARKRATEREAHSELLDIIDLETQLFMHTQDRDLLTTIDAQEAAMLSALDAHRIEIRLAALRARHQALRKTRPELRDANHAARMRAILEDPLLAPYNVPTSFRAALDYNHIHGHQALLERDFERALNHFEAAYQGWKSRPDAVESTPSAYIRFLTRYLSACMYAKHWNRADEIISKLQAVDIRSPEDEITLLHHAFYTQLIYCLNVGQYEMGCELLERLDPLLKTHQYSIPPARKISFYYNATILHFLHEDYRRSLNWLNRIINLPKSDLRQHLRDFTRIFQLILHHELGNHDLVEYLLRSTYRHYKGKRKAQNKSDFEQELLSKLKNLLMTFDKTEFRDLADQLYRELWQVAQQPKGKEPAGLYELIFWLQSKSEGRSLRAVYAQRVQERMELVAEKARGVDADRIRELEEREKGPNAEEDE
ncbi:MAG: hypothetical protein AAF570_09835 [Bacteroidota bacterium]